MITTQIVADSKHELFGTRITSMLVTFPRFILGELNTHRMFSRNSASSRAIPFAKMVQSVILNPFVPIAFQKDHKGMQGTEYMDPTEVHSIRNVIPVLQATIVKVYDTEEDYSDEAMNFYKRMLLKYEHYAMTLPEWWLFIRDQVVEVAMLMNAFGMTKQLANRLLEPFMWHTVLITSTEWENFFALRCPQYNISKLLFAAKPTSFRSRKSAIAYTDNTEQSLKGVPELQWLKINDGQAEIHMMALAEAMWDAYNESTPRVLKPGEWHIVYEDKINELFDLTQQELDTDGIPFSVKIGVVMGARTSYTVAGTDLSTWDIDKYAKKCKELAEADPFHASPFEHCSQAMDDNQFHENVSGTRVYEVDDDGSGDYEMPLEALGWCGNFRGFIQYRKMFANENITADV